MSWLCFDLRHKYSKLLKTILSELKGRNQYKFGVNDSETATVVTITDIVCVRPWPTSHDDLDSSFPHPPPPQV